MLDEQIYLDKVRLDNYIQRLFGSTETTDKIEKIGGEISLTPKITFGRDQRVRNLTDEEKISRFEKLLLEKDKLTTQRPSERFGYVEFVSEHFEGIKIIVPQNAEPQKNTPAFAFWLALETEESGMLCLLEDCRSDDDKPYNYARASTYTVLQSLIHFARSEVRKSILAKQIPDRNQPNPYAQIDETHPPSLFNEFHNVKDVLYEFVKSPLDLLRKWGCIVSQPRRVYSLYRVREYGPEAAQSFSKVTTFAYPIYIYSEMP